MNEFKFHVNRSFGTEQFTYSATINSDKISPSDEEIQQVVSGISTAIHTQLKEVYGREPKEKILSAENLDARHAANKKLAEAIAKVNVGALLEKYTPDELNAALNAAADQKEEEVAKPILSPVQPEDTQSNG